MNHVDESRFRPSIGRLPIPHLLRIRYGARLLSPDGCEARQDPNANFRVLSTMTLGASAMRGDTLQSTVFFGLTALLIAHSGSFVSDPAFRLRKVHLRTPGNAQSASVLGCQETGRFHIHRDAVDHRR